MYSGVGYSGRFAFLRKIVHFRASTSPCSEGTPQERVFLITPTPPGGSRTHSRGDAGTPRNRSAQHPTSLILRFFHAKYTNLRSCRHLVGLNIASPEPQP